MRRFLALAIVALAPLLGAGCGSDSITDPRQAVAGSYALMSFDGKQLPATILAGDPQVDVVSDELMLTSSGSFTQNTTFRVTESGVTSTQAVADVGTYTVSGSTVTFRFSADNFTGTATVLADGLSITSEGHTLTYAKR